MLSIKSSFKIFFVLYILVGCSDQNFTVIKSQSYDNSQVKVDSSFFSANINIEIDKESSIPTYTASERAKFDSFSELVDKFELALTNEFWLEIESSWSELQKIQLGKSQNSREIIESQEQAVSDINIIKTWLEQNDILLKITGAAMFAEEIERLTVSFPALISVVEISSYVFTHVFDRIYLNILLPSELTHNHTTGGQIKLIQSVKSAEKHYTLSCETSDTRFLSVFIRIPSWAINPTVNHGNVKYVARPGEYTEISRKWKNGDVFDIKLLNN